jgi:uncharacterized phiE125 gp8 family phage protein
MALKVITPPVNEPVTLAEASLWMRYDQTMQTSVITALITAARIDVETWTNRTLIDTTYEYYLPNLCSSMDIPTSTVQSITSITYIDTNGTEQTLDPTLYALDNISIRNKVYRLPNQFFPDVQVQPNAVKMTFPAGFGADGTDVPQNLRQGLLMRLAELFEYREANTSAPRQPNKMTWAMLSPSSDYGS